MNLSVRVCTADDVTLPWFHCCLLEQRGSCEQNVEHGNRKQKLFLKDTVKGKWFHRVRSENAYSHYCFNLFSECAGMRVRYMCPSCLSAMSLIKLKHQLERMGSVAVGSASHRWSQAGTDTVWPSCWRDARHGGCRTVRQVKDILVIVCLPVPSAENTLLDRRGQTVWLVGQMGPTVWQGPGSGADRWSIQIN